MTKLSISQQQKIREIVLKETPEGIYQMVLDGRLPRFPRGFWSMPENYDYARKCTRYLLEEVLHWDKETICRKITSLTFRSLKLSGMFTTIFEENMYPVFKNAYPNIFQPWDFNFTCKGYWTSENIGLAIHTLYTKTYKYNRKFILTTLTGKFLLRHGLGNLRLVNSLFDLLNLGFPNEFKPWELHKVSVNYWNTQTLTEAVRWLYTEKYPWSKQFVVDNHSVAFLIKHGLAEVCTSIGIFEALDLAFPNIFSPSDFPNYTHKSNISGKNLAAQNIESVLSNESPIDIYKKVLNGKLNRFPFGFWSVPQSKLYAKIYMKYLIEDILKWDKYKICNEFTESILVKYRLGGMLSELFNKIIIKALDNAYPDCFQPWDLNLNYSKLWNSETIKFALIRLYTETYLFNKNFVKKTLSQDFIFIHGIRAFQYKPIPQDLLFQTFPSDFTKEDLLCEIKD